MKSQIKKHFGSRYLYEFAESAEEAWEIIEELHEDGVRILIIVSDWLMPNTKGDEFLIRVHQYFPDIVKVMLTGHANDEAIEHARQLANLYSCLHKPWQEQELISIIELSLENR